MNILLAKFLINNVNQWEQQNATNIEYHQQVTICQDVKIDINLCEIIAEGNYQIKTASGKNKCKYTDDYKKECKYYEVNNLCQLTDTETVACTEDNLNDQKNVIF